MLRPQISNLKKLTAVALVAGFSISSCHVDDTDSTSTVTTTDTSANMRMDNVNTGVDTASMSMPSATTTMAADSNAASAQMTTAAPATASKGNAKPNPAKKGMKGKVTVAPAPKNTAKMEMDNNGVYSNVEVIPSFPGGYKGLQKYFDDNLTYPMDASNDGVDGTVNVSFTVDENGKLSSPTIQGERLGYGLEEEALRVVNKMPTWTPGKLKGQNVKTRFTLPVRFQLY
ncbi:MAG: energy transducer TonB [Ferruginibacter sp.]|nr:energy transducer TonB [Ferruginibacter sp.]